MAPEPVLLFGIPVDFILFGLTLLGVAVFHHHTLQVALTGLSAITLYKLGFTGFKYGAGLSGLAEHMRNEGVVLANLFLLLMGFALLSRHFEKSRVPDEMPRFLPDDWRGGFALLLIVAVISSFLDNIAAALIGGTMAQQVFLDRCRRQRWRVGQRGGRHHHHHDVDRWREPVECARGLYRRQRGARRVRHPRRHPAA